MMWDAERANKVLEILKREYKIVLEDYVSLWAHEKFKDPFKVLIATILSQSSTDKAALISFKNLEERIGVDPVKLATADLKKIEEAIRFSGLQKQKAKAIKEIAEKMKNFDLNQVLELDLKEAREKLMSLPKVGPKTADVLLATFGRNVIPVDTHVERVAKRLGIVSEEAKYEEIRSRLEELFKNERHLVHLLLIAHGRKVCKSNRPLCESCKISDFCLYFKLYKS